MCFTMTVPYHFETATEIAEAIIARNISFAQWQREVGIFFDNQRNQAASYSYSSCRPTGEIGLAVALFGELNG